MSELLDNLTSEEPRVEVLDPPSPDDEFDRNLAFDRFLARLVPSTPDEAGFGRAFLYAAAGSALALLGSFALMALPSGDSIRESGFYLVGKVTLGNLVEWSGSLAMPLAILAAALLLATGVLYVAGRRDGLSSTVCVAQPVVGVASLGGALVPWALIVAVVVLNLALYAVIAFVVFAALGAFLMGAVR